MLAVVRVLVQEPYEYYLQDLEPYEYSYCMRFRRPTAARSHDELETNYLLQVK